ncbi:MAG: ABC transporter permease [Dictyoglomus sp.]
MSNLKELINTTSVVISFILGFIAAYIVVRELNYSVLFKNEKSIGAWIGRIIIFFFIASFVWVLLSSFFILLRIQE